MSGDDRETPTDRFERIRHVFSRALEVAPAARAAFMRDACGDDAALREEVLSLLGRGAQDDRFDATMPRSRPPARAESPAPRGAETAAPCAPCA